MWQLLVWVESTAVPTWVRQGDTIWAYPTVLTLHTFGLAVVVGTSAILNLRLLGMGGHLPLSRMRVLLPVMWFGFCLNAVTGLLLFAADATAKGSSPLFAAKLVFVGIAVAAMVVLDRAGYYGAEADLAIVSRRGKLLALSSLVAWVAAVSAGRLLAYV
jgi:hypothetical protein